MPLNKEKQELFRCHIDLCQHDIHSVSTDMVLVSMRPMETLRATKRQLLIGIRIPTIKIYSYIP